MSGIVPILDRIAAIESRFGFQPAGAQRTLGSTLGSSSATRSPAAGTASTGVPRFDQALAAAEAAGTQAALETGALPPGLELISANAQARLASATASPSVVTTTPLAVGGVPASPSAWVPITHDDHAHGPDDDHAHETGVAPVSGTASVASRSTGTGLVPAGTPFADLFARAGTDHGVPADLLAAVGWVESRYDVGALSPDGAIGLMQFMPGTAAELGVDPHDPASAIDGAARLLRSHRDRFGSWEVALAAYFSGPGAVSRNGGQAPPRGAEYAARVIERMETT